MALINYAKLKQIIQLLNDSQFHSGSELGNALGLTRGGVWKLIAQLKEIGVDIEAKTRQGYRLLLPIEFLDLQKIKSHLSPSHQNYIDQAEIFSEIDSTHSRMLDKVHQADRSSLLYLAERQTAGRGRVGRPWHAPFARNIMLSLLWQTNRDFGELSGLSLVVAIAISKALKRYGAQGVELKWPNDILWQKRKIAGVLIELHSELNASERFCDVIISFGLNLYLPESLHSSADYPIADLTTMLNKYPERNKLLAEILDELLTSLAYFSQQGLTPFIPLWEELDCAFNKPVNILMAGSTIEGINRGVTDRGYIRLETGAGEMRNFSSGEVSLRIVR